MLELSVGLPLSSRAVHWVLQQRRRSGWAAADLFLRSLGREQLSGTGSGSQRPAVHSTARGAGNVEDGAKIIVTLVIWAALKKLKKKKKFEYSCCWSVTSTWTASDTVLVEARAFGQGCPVLWALSLHGSSVAVSCSFLTEPVSAALGNTSQRALAVGDKSANQPPPKAGGAGEI